MTVVIQSANNAEAKADAHAVREEVFNREWGLRLPSLLRYDEDDSLTLVARTVQSKETVAVLTVVDTTTYHSLHRNLSLNFREGSRTARYTQLAVLKPYRGLNLPIQLILSARQQFVVPRGIEHTWLLFDAHRAKSSALCRILGYQASAGRVWSEYGWSRLLVRDETGSSAEIHDQQANAYLGVVDANNFREKTAA